nr:immunoglobulin light chain junction region [Macaca mulatta]
NYYCQVWASASDHYIF